MNFQDVVDQAVGVAVAKVRQDECKCTNTEVRERSIRGGSKQFIRQCLDCGESVGNPVRQVGVATPFDESLRTTIRDRQKLARDLAKKQESDFWWGEYKMYMASPEWKRIRSIVLARDLNVCQGCLTEPASEVHHKTYEHFGKEFAFELISLCNSCHKRMHAA